MNLNRLKISKVKKEYRHKYKKTKTSRKIWPEKVMIIERNINQIYKVVVLVIDKDKD